MAAAGAIVGAFFISGRTPVPGAAGWREETILFPEDFLLTKCALGGPCNGTPTSFDTLQWRLMWRRRLNLVVNAFEQQLHA